MAPEEAIGLADRVLAAHAGAAYNASKKRWPVVLCRDEAVLRFTLLELVDQVQLVVALDRPRVCLGLGIADCTQDQHQGGQSLLPIHDQIGRHAACSRGNRRENDAAEEMPRLAWSGPVRRSRVLLQDVSPEEPVIGHSPCVLALPQRHTELFLTLHELLKVRLAYLHLPSIGASNRVVESRPAGA